MTDMKKKAPQAQLCLSIGDENDNGRADVTLTCTVLGKTWPSITKDFVGGPGVIAAVLGVFATVKDLATKKPGESALDDLASFAEAVAPLVAQGLQMFVGSRAGIGRVFAQGEHASSLD